MDLRKLPVQASRQAYQGLGLGGNRLEDRLVEADPYGKLDEHGPQAAEWVYALLFVDLHGLLREALPVL